MESETKELPLIRKQWVLVIILSLVAGAIGRLLTGGFTIAINIPQADTYEHWKPELEGPR